MTPVIRATAASFALASLALLVVSCGRHSYCWHVSVAELSDGVADVARPGFWEGQLLRFEGSVPEAARKGSLDARRFARRHRVEVRTG